MRVDLQFLLECSTSYFASKRSERMRYQVELERKKIHITSSYLLFCLLYEQTNDDFLDGFLNVSQHFVLRIPKILQKLFEGQTIVFRHL